MKQRKLKRFLLGLLMLWLVFLTVLRSHRVLGSSMYPTIRKDDWVMVWCVVPDNVAELRGQIVSFVSPDDRGLSVKRVIALAGDEVKIRKNRLLVNGRDCGEVDMADKTWRLKKRELFVVGDNRTCTFDSCDHGPIKQSQLVGIIQFKFLPEFEPME